MSIVAKAMSVLTLMTVQLEFVYLSMARNKARIATETLIASLDSCAWNRLLEDHARLLYLEKVAWAKIAAQAAIVT